MFPTQIRYTSMSVPYHLGTGWFRGFLPLIATALTASDFAKAPFGKDAVYAGLIPRAPLSSDSDFAGRLGTYARTASQSKRARHVSVAGSFCDGTRPSVAVIGES